MEISALRQLVIQPLDVLWCDLGYDLISELRSDMIFHCAPVSDKGGGADCPGDIIQPLIQPLAQRHGTVFGQVYALVGVDVLTELCGQLFLSGSVDVAEDRVTIFFVAYHDAALPPTVVTLSHHAVARWSALRHLLLTSSPNITVVFVHALGHQPDTQSETQNEILGCCDTVDLML